jgi:hypothetical protein
MRLLRAALQQIAKNFFNEIAKKCPSARMLREKGKISKETNELEKVMPNL